MPRFAYYCSAHGFGHATRVVAVTEALLESHEVYIVTNAASHIFQSAQDKGAVYRQADIDAGISQPKAYDVDRVKTFDGLQSFLSRREKCIAEEAEWLKANRIQAVLVDAPFLPCAAAAAAGIPSAIISNFTFDSCYSYLDAPAQTYTDLEDGEDVPLKTSDLEAPVSQTVSDYQHASLLLRLPGAIPLPAFDLDVPMPSSRWVDRAKNSFTKEVEAILSRPASSIPCNTSSQTNRKVVDTPLITRRPSPNAYKPDYQRAFLTSVGVPASLQNKETKILILSFGGQNIKRPSATPTPSSSRPPSPSEPSPPAPSLAVPSKHLRPTPIRAVTDAHLYLSGAPAAETHTTPPAAPKELKDNLLPESWIALVCGLNGEASADLPRGFYACPRDVYVPDLCAMADVVLGKLGYGTCSECVTAQLPFVYVPRPLFVEEWGLKRLMEQRGTVVEMDRTTFEQGNWANHILQAHEEGRKKGRKPIEDEKADEFIVKELEKWLAEQGI